MMEAIKDTLRGAKNAVEESSLGSNKKIASISNDIVDGHQSSTRMTTDHGVPISEADNEFWLSVVDQEGRGRQGPQLLEDQIAREKMHRFDHERIPERVIHARGAGAHGYFKLKESASDVTSASVLTDTSRKTPCFVRFSTVMGSRGSADTVRDVRGFAVKMYTDEGNWDIVGNDIPVFFIQNSIKFPDLVHSVKPEPDNEVPQAQSAHNNFWDFAYLHQEATHMFMWAMSDRGIPRSYRMMQGFGVNTYTLINDKGERHFVKFHFKPELGVHSLVWDEALKLNGQDPDFHRKDLEEAIKNGAPATWDFGIQVLPESRQDEFDFDILDATKLWPEELIPVRYIGELVLDRCVDEYFTETEQVAFCTSHVVPGIGFSDDPLLLGRNFSYFDTQLSRLGINWQELPINRPVCPYMNNNRDGQGRHRITKGKANYWPNRFEATPPVKENENYPAYHDYPEVVRGIKARLQAPKFKEYLNQATMFWNSQTPIEKLHIIKAFSFELDHCDDPIVYERLCERLHYIDLELAQKVALQVGGPVPDKEVRPNHGQKSAGMSIFNFPANKPTIKSRRIAILIADGYDKTVVQTAKAAFTAAGAVPLIIAPRRNYIYAAGEERTKGNSIFADNHFEGQRSTMFDAIFIPPGAQHALTLRESGRAVHYVREAFAHLKPIAAMGESVHEFLQKAVILPGVEIAMDSSSSKVTNHYGVTTVGSGEASGIKETINLVKDASDFISAFAYDISCHRIWDRELDGLVDKVAY